MPAAADLGFPVQMSLERDGYVLIERLFATDVLEPLKTVLARGEISRAQRGGETFGARNILAIPEVRSIARNPRLHEFLGKGLIAVRGLFFDKTPGANWRVAWHQDLMLALRERRAIEGWTSWTSKHGVIHARAPAATLARMITMRLHLDDCGTSKGPLRVIAGSHALGQLSRDEITGRTVTAAHVVVANAGDALLMKPLLLHASSPATAPSHRRVLHLEFAPHDLLPTGLEWAATA